MSPFQHNIINDGSDDENDNNSIASENTNTSIINENDDNDIEQTDDEDEHISIQGAEVDDDDDIDSIPLVDDSDVDDINEDGDGDGENAPSFSKKGIKRGTVKTDATPNMMLGVMDMITDDQDSDDSLSIDNEMQLNGVMGDDDEYEDDDDEDPDVYFQKFDEEINSNYILKQHPEQFNKNYDEIETLSAIIRDNNNNIIDSLHKTIPYLTKYERSRVLGQRAKQINSGSKPYVAVPDNIIDGYIIAQMELAQKRIPFIIQRPIYGGACEYWKLKDLEILV